MPLLTWPNAKASCLWKSIGLLLSNLNGNLEPAKRAHICACEPCVSSSLKALECSTVPPLRLTKTAEPLLRSHNQNAFPWLRLCFDFDVLVIALYMPALVSCEPSESANQISKSAREVVGGA